MDHALIAPMAAHVALAASLYVVLTVARASAVWNVASVQSWAAYERRISANLSNQFEWPLFFHVACVLLMVMGGVTRAAVVLAWVFVIGRVIHGGVQILTTNVRLRGLVFTINFVAVLAMWILVWLAP